MKDLTRLKTALRELWAKLPADRRAKLDAMALAGHEYLLAAREQARLGTPPKAEPPVPRELLLVHSLLHDDPHGLLADAEAPESWLTWVTAEGGVMFGGVDYDLTDAYWAYCVWAWNETGPTVPFLDDPPIVPIPDTVTLAILGDWGGNNGAARAVAQAAKARKPGLFVHLGDVYYAGTNENGRVEVNYQDQNFLDPWPGAVGASFNLNSNHDMYAHAVGYFGTLGAPVFSAQKGCSYFALVSSGFRLVGLDTAYFDPDQSGSGFMTGALNPSQETFLQEQGVAASKAGQQLVLLTHHNGLSMDGGTRLPLWDQVSTQLGALGGKQVIWYFGHEHIGAVYGPQKAGEVTILPRCCGHGCIPWGIPSDLQGSSEVLWFEDRVLGPGPNYFVTNGFATLAIEGSSVTETFYDQEGNVRWESPAGLKPAGPASP